ncbi:unnamed protein product [Clonostachys chloroleuca]|uniref:Uncharacterized protein n=1 Tax=Clonostachys chloroleuca TaxID=1926264 RepID=A0AA35M0D7_9HYPO|nr:unnamed protein product [Clonostachys chloroleuca]
MLGAVIACRLPFLFPRQGIGAIPASPPPPWASGSRNFTIFPFRYLSLRSESLKSRAQGRVLLPMLIPTDTPNAW